MKSSFIPLLCSGLLLAGCPAETSPPDSRIDVSIPDQAIPDAAPDASPFDVKVYEDLVFLDLRIVASKMIPLPAGSFQMGSPATDTCRLSNEDYHKVTLTRKFALLSTEVTQQQFYGLMGYLPFTSCGPTCPVSDITWHEAAAYTNALSKKNVTAQCYTCTGTAEKIVCATAAAYASGGKTIYDCPGYRLPTEAEWEYACRAKTTTALYSGKITGGCTSGADPAADKIAWYAMNSTLKIRPGGQKQPNAWGLYDMAGNVNEWVHDRYADNLGGVAVTDPVGSKTGTENVLKGGSYELFAGALRAAARQGDLPVNPYDDYGLRVARTIP